MILDKASNASLYKMVLPQIVTALEKASLYTPDNYPGGCVEVDGKNLFLILNSYETHSPESALMEAHKKYVDVMYMLEGEEIVYVKPTDNLSHITQAYDEINDALLASLDDDATPVRLKEGSFLVLFPDDAHAPGCYVNSSKRVKKIIAKIKL